MPWWSGNSDGISCIWRTKVWQSTRELSWDSTEDEASLQLQKGKFAKIWVKDDSVIFLIPQALEYCTLGHVLSLWETLSVELAKQLTLSDQVYTHAVHISLIKLMVYRSHLNLFMTTTWLHWETKRNSLIECSPSVIFLCYCALCMSLLRLMSVTENPENMTGSK